MTLVGWSSVPLFLYHFRDQIDFWTSNGWRYGFSALLWLPVLLAVLVRGRLPRGLWVASIVPSAVNAAGQVCFTWAHYCINPGMVTFGLRTQLVFVAIGAWLLFPSERAVIRTRGYLLGMAALLVGTTLVLLSGIDGGPAEGENRLLGVPLAILSGLLFAGYGLSVRRFMSGFHPVIAFAAICQYTGGAMVALMFLFGDACADGAFLGLRGMTALEMSTEQFLYLLLSAVIGIALGHVFYYIAIANLGVAVAAGVLQLQPFLVALAQIPLFGAVLAPTQWAGGCLAVLGALAMLEMQRRVSARRSAAGASAQAGPSGAEAIAPEEPRRARSRRAPRDAR